MSVANLDLKMVKSTLLLLLLINIALASTLDNAPGKETNRVRRRGQSSSDASAKRTQFKEECGDDAACVRQKMREWRKARKAGHISRVIAHLPVSLRDARDLGCRGNE